MKNVFEDPVVLSDEEQLALLAEHQTANPTRRCAIQELFCSCYTRVISTAISGHNPDTIDDLRQCGFLAVIRAMDKFDPAEGTAFYVFCSIYISGYIQKALAGNQLIHYPETSVWRPIRKIKEFLRRNPSTTDRQVCKALGMSPKTLTRCKGIMARPPQALSLDNGDLGSSFTAGGYSARSSTDPWLFQERPHGVHAVKVVVVGGGDASPTRDLSMQAEEVSAVRTALSQLSPREARAVRLLYGIDSEQLTEGCIARRMRMTKSDCLRLLATAKAKLVINLRRFKVEA